MVTRSQLSAYWATLIALIGRGLPARLRLVTEVLSLPKLNTRLHVATRRLAELNPKAQRSGCIPALLLSERAIGGN